MITVLRLSVGLWLLGSTLLPTRLLAVDSPGKAAGLEQYEYPGATQVGAGASWRDYRTTDEFTKVVDFYRARIATKPLLSTNQGALFDTGGLTITVVRGERGNVEVMIRHPDKRDN